MSYRSRSALWWWGLPLVLAATTIRADPEQPKMPEPGVRIEHVDGMRRVDVVLPGPLIGYALPRRAGGGVDVILLVRPAAISTESTTDSETPEDGKGSDDTRAKLPPCPSEEQAEESMPLTMLRLDPTGNDGLVVLARDLAHDATTLDAVDLDDDGDDELLLATPGRLTLIGLEGAGSSLAITTRRTVLEQSGILERSRRARADRLPWAAAADLGSLRLFGPRGGQSGWELLAEVELPVRGDLSERGVRLTSRVPAYIGGDAAGRRFFATWPETFGTSRLRTTLVTVEPSGETTVSDTWARLPEPEEVLGRSFLMLDGQPRLLVSTKPAEKLNLFGEKRIRIYSLENDRSRLGRPPLFAAESRMNLWQDGHPRLVDVNGDGRDDLVLGYWKGLMGARVVLDAYLRREDGSFDKNAKETIYDVKKGDRSFVEYGADLTGDSLPDLLVRGKKGLLVYIGRPSKNGRNLVGSRPRVIPAGELEGAETSVEVGFGPAESFASQWTSRMQPRVIDLDGDGRSEIVMSNAGGRGMFRALWLDE